MVRRLSIAALGALALAACAVRTEEPAASTSSRIVHGTASDASQNEVVFIARNIVKGTSITDVEACSGTLIAANLVLTAWHCVASVSATGFVCDDKGGVLDGDASAGADHGAGELMIFTGTKTPAGLGTNRAKPVARGAKIVHPDAKALCSNDIALIILDAEIPDAKIAPIRLTGKPAVKETITATGFGLTEASQDTQRMQRTGVAVVRVGPAKGNFTSAPLPPNDFEVSESICDGDSGGPALATETGAVIGVVSRGGNSSQKGPPSSCLGADTRNVYTSTAPFKDLILKTFKEAGAEPWLEGAGDPRLTKLGGTCVQARDCQGNVCTPVTGAGQVCSQACSDSSPCPSGFGCATNAGAQVCIKGAPGSEGEGGCAAAPASRARGSGVDLALALAACAALAGRRRRAGRQN